jgi:hypothetical protein
MAKHVTLAMKFSQRIILFPPTAQNEISAVLKNLLKLQKVWMVMIG